MTTKRKQGSVRISPLMERRPLHEENTSNSLLPNSPWSTQDDTDIALYHTAFLHKLQGRDLWTASLPQWPAVRHPQFPHIQPATQLYSVIPRDSKGEKNQGFLNSFRAMRRKRHLRSLPNKETEYCNTEQQQFPSTLQVHWKKPGELGFKRASGITREFLYHSQKYHRYRI